MSTTVETLNVIKDPPDIEVKMFIIIIIIVVVDFFFFFFFFFFGGLNM